MVLLLGASGYIGQAFEDALKKQSQPFLSVSRSRADYCRFDVLVDLLAKTRCNFLINAAGFTGKPNVDACEAARADTLRGNTLLPVTIAHACATLTVPWGHVSSGCIYSGAKISEDGHVRVVKDLTVPAVRHLCESDPKAIRGFTETDTPNFSFREPPCSFYSGTKALAEEAILGIGQCYIWRMRIPFDEQDNPRNYLTKIQSYPKVYDNVNSLSHRGDFARACLELWERRAPFGIYNLTNPGYVTTRQVTRMLERSVAPGRQFEFWANDQEFYRLAAKTPRSNCILDVSKTLAAGVKLRSVESALQDSLLHWKRK
jgi:dTDP-4-dehydrorhamnose reductase